MRRLVRYLLAATMLAIVGFGLAAMYLLPGVQLAEGVRRVYPCDHLPGRAVPSLGARHLSYLGERHGPYNSVPPTSGPHMPWLISPGVYDDPQAEKDESLRPVTGGFHCTEVESKTRLDEEEK